MLENASTISLDGNDMSQVAKEGDKITILLVVAVERYHIPMNP